MERRKWSYRECASRACRAISAGVLVGSTLILPAYALPSDSMLAGSTRLSNNQTMYFRLYVPRNYSTSKKYPLVMCLHGIGERGSDNRAQVDRENMSHQWMLDSVKSKYQPFVLYPQCPANDEWVNYMSGNFGYSAPAGVGAVKIIDSLIKVYPIDTTRLYVGGLSWGGMGTQGIMMTYPKKFAAAFPCAGINKLYTGSILAQTPFWAWHGSADPTVNVSGSRDLCAAVESVGKKVVRFVSGKNMTNPTGISVDSLRRAVAGGALYLYSEVTNGNHADGWNEAFFSPLLVPWLMSKSKVDGQSVFTWPAPGPAGGSTPVLRQDFSVAGGESFTVSGTMVHWQGVSPVPSFAQLFTAKGVLIKRFPVNTHNGTLSLGNVPTGVYVLSMSDRRSAAAINTLPIAHRYQR